MTEPGVETSPQVYARTGGALYLYIIVAGGFGESFRGKLIESGDATATANKILAAEQMYRISVAAELLHLVCAVVLSLIFYVLLRPVSKNLVLLATFFGLISVAVEAVSRAGLFAVLFPLGGAEYLKAFEPRQLHALAYLSLRLYDYGFAISLVFFGCCLFLYGYLIFRSDYFPRFLGVLPMMGALCYLINSFALFAAPAFAARIFPAILVPAGLSELILCLWLLVKGVNVAKWEKSANRLAS